MRLSTLRRWDAITRSQLCEHIHRLAGENDALREALARERERADSAEQWAEQWREDFMRLCAQPGITQSGRLAAKRPAHLNPPATNTGD